MNAGQTLPRAPVRLLGPRQPGQPTQGSRQAGPTSLKRLRTFRITCEVGREVGVSLRPTMAGVHAVVSGWLHSKPGGKGEPHDAEHPYSVRWEQQGGNRLLVELRGLSEPLTQCLLGRVSLGTPVVLGRAAGVVTRMCELPSQDLAALHGRARNRSVLEFSRGVTFRSGDLFVAWPSPQLVLGSIERRLALVSGMPRPGGLVLKGLHETVIPVSVSLKTEAVTIVGGGTAGRREVRFCTGHVEWLCVGDDKAKAAVDRLLQIGQLTGIGAMTGWGLGALDVVRSPSSRRIAASGNRRLHDTG